MRTEIKNIIERNPLALATLSGNKPHIIAVGDVRVIGNSLLIGDNYMKETIKNIQKNKNVSLLVLSLKGSYELSGRVEYFKSGKWLDAVREIHKGYLVKGALLVKVNKIKKLK